MRYHVTAAPRILERFHVFCQIAVVQSLLAYGLCGLLNCRQRHPTGAEVVLLSGSGDCHESCSLALGSLDFAGSQPDDEQSPRGTGCRDVQTSADISGGVAGNKAAGARDVMHLVLRRIRVNSVEGAMTTAFRKVISKKRDISRDARTMYDSMSSQFRPYQVSPPSA